MEPGTSNQSTSPVLKFVFGFGRCVGFLLLAGPAMAILASVVLLPAYQQMMDTVHHRDVAQAQIDWYKDYIDASNRLIAELPENELLTIRLESAQKRLQPRNEVVLKLPTTAPTQPPGRIFMQPPRKPPMPDNLLLTMAKRVEQPQTRRGLFLLAALAMLAAMFLFSPAEKYEEKSSQ